MRMRLAMMAALVGACVAAGGCAQQRTGAETYTRVYPLVDREPEARFIRNVVHGEMEQAPAGTEQFADLTPDGLRMMVRTTLSAHVYIRKGLETMRSEEFKLTRRSPDSTTQPATAPTKP